MTLLGVNIDHVATVRQARRGELPSVLDAARAVLAGGADSITVHLREDRRHIQDRDVTDLKKEPGVRLNLEMASSDEMVAIARAVGPDSVCLVPENRLELTTEGGLNVAGQVIRLRSVCGFLKEQGVRVSLFIDPNEDQILACQEVGADWVELHTGAYAGGEKSELEKIKRAGVLCRELGLGLNAGHGLDYDNVGPVASLPGMQELNIGFSIVARALFVGLEQATREMIQAMKR